MVNRKAAVCYDYNELKVMSADFLSNGRGGKRPMALDFLFSCAWRRFS
jgi:hypothetical protein